MIFHRYYNEWQKWRLVTEGGDAFIRSYLQQYSKREDTEDFQFRADMTYCPAFAKTELRKIQNAIAARLCYVQRSGGPSTYIKALNNNIDRHNHSMNSFISEQILPELLAMARVGIYVDMPPLNGPTLADRGDASPYIYIYQTEQIKKLIYTDGELTYVELEDTLLRQDNDNTYSVARKIEKINGEVIATLKPMDEKEDPISVKLGVSRIPFIVLELSDSLLCDAANYQIALLNLESSNINFAVRSNFPLYTEQFDSRTDSNYMKTLVGQEPETEVKVGPNTGRRYPINTERPAFIHPSPDPLKVSMELGKQLKADIEYHISLALSNLKATNATQPYIGDPNTPEAGLSYIAFELEAAERKIAELWADYENTKSTAWIRYPSIYSLKSHDQRMAEVKELQATVPSVPSLTAQKEISKIIVDTLIGDRVSTDILEKIKKEIQESDIVVIDPKVMQIDLENGLVGVDFASKARGYPEGQVAQAKQDHAERIARIAAAQTPGLGAGAAARGVNDADPNAQKSAKAEKTLSRDTTFDGTVTDKTRGEGK